MNDKTFIFEEYILQENNKELLFRYAYEENGHITVRFEERLILPQEADFTRLPKHLLESLHLILGISYYKLYCPKKIIIKNFTISQQQSEFWNTVYTKGLGEFFYVNKLDFRNHIHFPFAEKIDEPPVSNAKHNQNQKALVSIGGGKDSIVSIEMVKELGIPFDLFSLNSYEVIKNVAEVVGKPVTSITRIIDTQLLELNKHLGTYNGHIPISAVYAFVSLLYASLFGYSYLVYSNEKSSNYGNADYLGTTVSHQWSKSQEFEDLFKEYVSNYITKEIFYFSYLRPLYEIAIAQIFARFPQYFEVFSSSNHNFRIQHNSHHRWNYNSPKTVFVFTLLAAFLTRDEMDKIFGADLFDMTELEDIFRELLGIKDIKPFDCVGTPEEVKVALYLAHQRGEYSESSTMHMFEKEILPDMQDSIAEMKNVVFSFGNAANIPVNFLEVLKKNV